MRDADTGYVWFLECLDALHRAIQRSSDIGEALNAALAVLLDVFSCDRAWLLEEQGETWTPVMERTRAEYPGGLELGVTQPLTPDAARRHRRALDSDWAVQLSAEEVASVVVPEGVAPPRAILVLAIYPKVGKPWILGLHQCSFAREWSTEEERLFVEIGHRLADALTSLLAYRDARESEQKLAQAQRVARLGYWERDVDTFEVQYSDETYRIFGLSPELDRLEPAMLAERLHPEDRHIMLEAYEQAIAGRARYDVDYRVLLPDGQVRYVHSEADVSRDAAGRPRRMFGTMQDITERKMLERQQEALRRVATLVASGAGSDVVFSIVAEEVGNLLASAELVLVARYASNQTVEYLAGWSADGGVDWIGRTETLGGHNTATAVFEAGQPARVDDLVGTAPITMIARERGARSSAGAPISVAGSLWGVITIASFREGGLPAGLEHQLAEFAELVASAIANTEARDELRTVAEEQAALRRVATLVARQASQPVIFNGIAEECGRLFGTPTIELYRYDGDATVVVASTGRFTATFPRGSRHPLGGENISTRIRQTGGAVRIDDYRSASGPIAQDAVVMGLRSAVGAPIIVEGKLWGGLIVGATVDEPLPPETEGRLGKFAELVAAAISNAEARQELTASRARIAASADETRRRIARDLHDGAQQRLVHMLITLQMAERALASGDSDQAAELLQEALEHAERTHSDLRDLVHGILPSALAVHGLPAAVEELVARSFVPASAVAVADDRLPPQIEATAYFVIAEAMTNVAKHSNAGQVEVRAWVDNAALQVEVSDDGVGGASPHGSGLVGLADRVHALGGRLRVHSPPGEGTRITATLPL